MCVSVYKNKKAEADWLFGRIKDISKRKEEGLEDSGKRMVKHNEMSVQRSHNEVQFFYTLTKYI